jgi:glucuronyl/N-acetylglucosaminyl transferase EXT1
MRKKVLKSNRLVFLFIIVITLFVFYYLPSSTPQIEEHVSVKLARHDWFNLHHGRRAGARKSRPDPYKAELLHILASNSLGSSFISDRALVKDPDEDFTTCNSTKSDVKCTMSACFDLSKCDDKKFRVFVYNQTEEAALKELPMSVIYSNILSIIRRDARLTNNPSEACIFILSIDTLDRDKLSSNFVRDLNAIVKNLTHWNNGENHVIFNMYSGSWPSYIENLEFDIGKAVLAKTSFSTKSYRRGFDISFPLFHVNLPHNSSFLPERDPQLALFGRKKYFLTFKGKRYLHGIGSETRDSLYHFNNKRDVFLLTTCKHGINWEEKKDERCDLDNELYEKFDYNDMLYNSTFCLVPRGRRLATYRFLESLKAG